MFYTGVSYAVIGTTLSAIRKYHITDGNTGFTKDKHHMVSKAKKAFWQLRPLPKYQGTYDVQILLRCIENLVENNSLILKQNSWLRSPLRQGAAYTGDSKSA